MFNIAFVPDMKNDLGYEFGYIMLGSSKEGFRSGLSYWSIAQYEKHWHEAVTRLVMGAESSALITDLPLSSSANDVINWWPMWREDEIVYIHEQLLFQPAMKGGFDPSDPYRHVDPREVETDEGQRISEWTVPLQDFVDYLGANPYES